MPVEVFQLRELVEQELSEIKPPINLEKQTDHREFASSEV